MTRTVWDATVSKRDNVKMWSGEMAVGDDARNAGWWSRPRVRCSLRLGALRHHRDQLQLPARATLAGGVPEASTRGRPGSASVMCLPADLFSRICCLIRHSGCDKCLNIQHFYRLPTLIGWTCHNTRH